jgi:exopolysaccharide biosynthesis WecB/TagA/CpsF family protein
MKSLISKKYLKISKKYGFDIFSGGKEQVLKVICEYIDDEKGFWQVATVNSEFVMEAKKDERFVKILKSTGLNTVDGIGLVWANQTIKRFENGELVIARFCKGVSEAIRVLRGRYRSQIASGSELIVEICKKAKEKKWKVFFLGGFGDTASLAGKTINKMVGEGLSYETSQGRPEFSDIQVFSAIQKFGVKILFVAYGMKRQEEWIYKNRKKLEEMGVRVAVGVGRSFDYYSGKVKMAPDWVKRMGLEWLYSLMKEPKRLKRQIVLPKFVWEVISN